MANGDDELTVAQRLGRLLDRGLLPAGGPAEAAERLIERLERPARVALLGLPGSGKSAILNLLAGTIVVPETLRLPTIIVQHGPEPRMLCTLSDGRNEIIPGDNLEKSLSLSPALITLELDLPALKVISLLEIAAGPQEVDQRRAALWAGKRADILIWCTTSYLPKEQLVWEGMPDAFKDNGFLLLTKVDLLGGRESAAGMHHRVEQRAGGEFRQVLSISAKEARVAMPPGGQVDRDRFRESGAGAVISTIKTRVQSARRADTDTAELIIARQAGPGEDTMRRSYEVAPQATPLVEVPSALIRTGGSEKTPLTIVAKSPPEPVTALPITKIPSPELGPEPEAKAEPEIPAEPKPGPQPDVTHLPELIPEPEPMPQVMEKMLVGQEADADVNLEQPFVSEAELAAEPEVEIVAEPAPPADIAPKPEPVKLNEPERAPDPVTVPEGTRDTGFGFLTSAGGQRLSDRIKQIRPTATSDEAPLVPLRATWKSRNEVSHPAVAEAPVEPAKVPRARPVDPSVIGRPTFRVSPAKEAAAVKGSASEPQSGDEPTAVDQLTQLEWSDANQQPDDIVQSVPIETPPDVLDSQKDTSDESVSEDGDLPEDWGTEGEDLTLARLSALRKQSNDTNAQSPGFVAEPAEDLASEVPFEPVADDPILARISALRDTRPDPSLRIRRDPPDTLSDTSGSIRSHVTEAAPLMPADGATVATLGDGAIEGSGPQSPVAEVQPAPEESSRASRDPTAAVVEAPERRSLSARLSQATDQPTGIPVEPAANLPSLGARMPRSGVPGSPRVTVIRERRVEVQPTERRDRPRITPASGHSVPSVADEPKVALAGEVELLDLAISTIFARSAELFHLIDPTEKLPVDLILDHGCETTEKVIDVVSKGNSAQMRRINGSLGELQDVIMLMQLEKGHAPADDTLTLLLQLRRELETLRSI